ncbi:type IV secretion system DNA-binding domain-containing protein [Sphingomonas sp. Tas61C01]|uniref:type IV secretion system DNA-binding domain-containing protein n=1 Tax=Sphingomonas sp. Tas61C01 TaxID=3458297 RepID=UPI00403E896F
MRHKFTNFTRGSQLLGHFGFMFAAGLKGPLMVTAATFTGLCWWRVSAALSDHESYLCWMRLYAGIYSWFEFDPAKAVNLETLSGAHVLLPMADVTAHPIVVAAWDRMTSAAGTAAMLAAIITVPAIAAFAWLAAWFGRRSKESRHERGATLAELPALVTEIEAHNARERASEYRRLLGSGWRYASAAELREAGLYEPYSLADVPYPWRLEQSHAMLIGTTGTGKTVALRDLLAQVRAKGARAVVFDLTGAFIEAFFDEATDTILNPLDARCPMWSIFEDCSDEAELTAASEALVPHDGGGSEQFWVLAARMLFVEMCLKLIRDGRATNEALSTELMTASLAHVHKLMEGTVADPLTAPEAARMAESIRAVFNANAKALRMLPTTGTPFSVKRWVTGDSKPGAILFVSARYVDMSVASRLLTVWMDTAMNTLMTLERSSDLRLWFLFDELGALHRLPAIEKGLQTVRNYGGAIVAGVHAYAKLKETYGENMAMTLSSLARTKLFLATADRESATWCSDFIGHRQYREMEEGYSYGYNNARDAVSLTPRRQIEPLLLPDQLMNLQRLRGYLKFPDGFPAAPIRLTYVDFPRRAEAFVARPRGALSETGNGPAGRPDEPPADGADAPGATDQGPGPSSDAREQSSPSDARSGPLFDYADQRPTEPPIPPADVPASASNPALAPLRPAFIKPPNPHASRASKMGGTASRGGQGEDAEPATRPASGKERSPVTPPPGTPGTVNAERGVRLLPSQENISLRELKSGVAPGDTPVPDDSIEL